MKKLKYLCLFLMILGFASLYFLGSCAKPYECEKILLPKDYTGWAIIVYRQKEGVKERKDGYRIYKIPENGVLFTKFQANTGVIYGDSCIQVFYVNEQDQVLSQLPVLNEMDGNVFNRKNDSIIGALTLPPQVLSKEYSIYPVIIDTVKNIFNYKQGQMIITEPQLDSLKRLLKYDH